MSHSFDALVKAASSTTAESVSKLSETMPPSFLPLVKHEASASSQLDTLAGVAGVANAADILEKDAKTTPPGLVDPMFSSLYPFRFSLLGQLSPFLLRPDLLASVEASTASSAAAVASSSAASMAAASLASLASLASSSASSSSPLHLGSTSPSLVSTAAGAPTSPTSPPATLASMLTPTTASVNTAAGLAASLPLNYLAFSPFLMNPLLAQSLSQDPTTLAAIANLNSLTIASLLNPNLLSVMQSLNGLKPGSAVNSGTTATEQDSPSHSNSSSAALSPAVAAAAAASSPAHFTRTVSVSPDDRNMSDNEDSPSPSESSVSYKSGSRKRSKVRVRKFFICSMPGCGQSLTTRFSLRRHMKRHTGERPFTCDTCAKQFAEKSTLQRHMLSHSGEKPYKCNFQDCPKAFADLPNLKHHQRTVHKLHASSSDSLDDSKPSASLATLADLFIANAK